MSTSPSTRERPLRILVLAPVGRDAGVIVDTLSTAGLEAEACHSMEQLCEQMAAGAGAAVIAAEALTNGGQEVLDEALDGQPEWSDFPIIVMDAPRYGQSQSMAGTCRAFISYAIILVRPVHGFSLISAARAALRSRLRQYQVRDELAERRRAEAALRESNERKDEFLAMLGHELRNPLAAIRNATELMRLTDPGDEKLLRAHQALERQSAHMTRLIDSLLEMSRIARGKIHLERERLDARQVIIALLHDQLGTIEAHGLELHESLADEPIWVFGDPVRLAQIFDNLISNAVKFTSPPGTITVTLEREDGSALFRVCDTGVGIQPDMIERLFDPFQQEPQDLSRGAGGLGLGLALAKGLVELHGGTIAAHSGGRGKGTKIVVRLPLTAAPAKEADAEKSKEVAGRRVLIVEDNQDAGETLRDLLELLGHEVTVVDTGSDALDALYRRGADIVLCDLGLPGMSGYDVARSVRDAPALRETPLVALTGYGQPEDRQRTRDAGFDEHLTKPIDLDALNAVLARLTEPPRHPAPRREPPC